MPAAAEAAVEANLPTPAELARHAAHLAEMGSRATIARVQGRGARRRRALASDCDICVRRRGRGVRHLRGALIIPAAISPYDRAIGARQASRYFQTAERILAARAGFLGGPRGARAADAIDAWTCELVVRAAARRAALPGAAKALIRAVADRR